MRSITIFDLDNVLSNDGERWKLVKSWHEFSLKGLSGAALADAVFHDYHEAAPFDKPGNLDTIDGPFVICTARPERYRGMTEKWLKRHGIGPVAMLMRPEGCCLPSPALKIEMARKVQAVFQHIKIAYDDRLDVIQAYRENNINAQRLKIHDVY